MGRTPTVLSFSVCNGLNNQLEGLLSGLLLAHQSNLGVVIPPMHTRRSFIRCKPNKFNCFDDVPFSEFFDEQHFIKSIRDNISVVLSYDDAKYILRRCEKPHLTERFYGDWVASIFNRLLRLGPECPNIDPTSLMSKISTRLRDSQVVQVKHGYLGETSVGKTCLLERTQLNLNPHALSQTELGLTRKIYSALLPNRNVLEISQAITSSMDKYGFISVQLRTERDWFDAHCRHKNKTFSDLCCQPPARIASILDKKTLKPFTLYSVGANISPYERSPFQSRNMTLLSKYDLLDHFMLARFKALSLEQQGLVDMIVAMSSTVFYCNSCSSMCRIAGWSRYPENKPIFSTHQGLYWDVDTAGSISNVVFGRQSSTLVVEQQQVDGFVCKNRSSLPECNIFTNINKYNDPCEDFLANCD